jgi:hypothetical protein
VYVKLTGQFVVLVQDGKDTLLSWVARQLVNSEPPSPLLSSEMPHVASPRLRVTLDEAGSGLAAVEAGLAAVRAELDRSSAEGGPADGRGVSSSTLGAVADRVERRVEAAKELLERCRAGFAALAAYYGETASAMAGEQDLWQPVQAFVRSFSAVQHSIQQQLQHEADRRRRGSPSPASAGSSRAWRTAHSQPASPAASPEGGRLATSMKHGGQHSSEATQAANGSQAAQQPLSRPGSATARQLDFPPNVSCTANGPPSTADVHDTVTDADAEASSFRLQELLTAASSGSDSDD